MMCSFCGYVFNEEGWHACKGCPLKAGCGKVKCPNCGYEMPGESFFRRWYRHRRRWGAGKRRGMEQQERQCREMLLADLSTGEKGIISQIATDNPAILNKLMALGILPGMAVTMLQKSPSYVFQVGNTRITADDNIVASVLVRKAREEERVNRDL